jgi:hypothetical protein
MSNLMRVLGTEAVQDPTKIEAHVRKQVQMCYSVIIIRVYTNQCDQRGERVRVRDVKRTPSQDTIAILN